mmetsp:Transcript_30867/g.57753  ORF Transcript_30867/g.57753 Transcript_30867/m.57753 type:complete len:782 (-) Transcript_30867:118-2463(-)
MACSFIFISICILRAAATDQLTLAKPSECNSSIVSLFQKTATVNLVPSARVGLQSSNLSEYLNHSVVQMPKAVLPELSMLSASKSSEVSMPAAGKDRISYLESVVRHLDPFYKEFIQQSNQSSKELVSPDKFSLESQNIWNESNEWVNFTFWHPAGVISNVNQGKVTWASVSFLSIAELGWLSFIAYPVIPIFVVLMWGIIVSLCITPKNKDEPTEEDDLPEDDLPENDLPYISPSKLTPRSQTLYGVWKLLCCCLPALLVFGVPLLLIALSYPYPQEVFVLTLVTSSAFAFSHGVYMASFFPFVIGQFRKCAELTGSEVRSSGESHEASSRGGLQHWVFFPNYKEDLDVLGMAVGSVARSTLAKTNIGIVLAMEQRESGSKEKAQKLQEQFYGQFRDIQVYFHPQDLPNDPPGKASNMAYAFKSLVKHLEGLNQDTSQVMLTVADADSEFDECYFEALSKKFVQAEDPQTTVWQSPVYHFKNYHRQPGPCVVGSLITAMVETAYLVDPNAIRFPYSTYSIPLCLALKVGGWDPEWIAEDWHMGIKCFLLTLGRAQVQPILLPTLNYSPEESTWSGTVAARWAQAKRHALGFSDLSYFFMMLPLIFVRIISSSKSPGLDLRGFWKLVFVGLAHIVRLVNTHVIIGVMTLYAILDMALKRVMMLALGQIRGISELFDRTLFAATMFAVATTSMTLIVTVNFQVLYRALEHRLEKPPRAFEWMYRNPLCHWVFTALCFAVWGVFYFTAMAAAAWMAAIKCMFFWRTGGFEYEVAAKPTKKNHL